MKAHLLPRLLIAIALLVSLMPGAQVSAFSTETKNETAREAPLAAPGLLAGYTSMNANISGWAVFTDTVYGYTVQYPASWYTYPADGSLGSVSILSSYDIQSATVPTDAVRIEIGVAIYDRAPEVSLRDWVAIPSDLASHVAMSPDRPSVYTDQMVVESYATPESSFRRAYVARGQKVYLIDLIPDMPSEYTLFTSVLQSLTFIDPVYRSQDIAPQLFGGGYHVFLPLVSNWGTSSLSLPLDVFTPQNVPSNYRLPFVGEYQITQGPNYINPTLGLTCSFSHLPKYGDSEAIDFNLPLNTPLYASESGTLRQYQLGSYGNVIKIEHTDHRVSWYAHLQSFERVDNPQVARETLIGKSGGSKYCQDGNGNPIPCSWPYHLHFMIQGPDTRTTEWIRSLPGITWYSGDANIPCNDGRYDHPGPGTPPSYYYDGYAVGPALGSNPGCGAPQLSSPSDGASSSTASVSFSWNTVSCATNGYLFRIKTVADMENGGATLQDIVTGTTQRTETIGSQWYNQDLYWSVKAANVANAAWASARLFRISPSVPPSSCPAPSLNSPSDGESFTSGSLTFSWNDVACSHNGFTFRIKTVSNMDSGGTVVIDTSNGTTQRTETIGSQWYNQDLYWSVKAANATNAAWATTRRFRVSPVVILSQPILSSPSNGANLPQTTDVTLVWSSSSGAAQYKVELWGGGYSLMTLCDWQNSTSCHIGTLWPGTMSWHVKARNNSGQESDWSETWIFTIQQTIPTVGVPTLSNPSNGASLAQTTDLTLVWNASTNATQYTVEIWGGPYNKMTPCDWQSGTSCYIGQMWPGTMSWHVKAKNASGQESDWSDTWSFTIQQGSSAGKPTLSNPANGASLAQSTDVTLVWNTSSGATQYKVELWGGPYSLMTPCNWQSGTSCHIGTMWPGTMSWHVKAKNSSGQESDWSDTWSFTIQAIPSGPSAPGLSSPGNGSSMAQSTDVTLVWNTSSGATQYKVELWGGPYSLMTPCDWQSGTSCHIGTMWPGTMSWHVKARNGSGQESDWSSTWSFTIQQPPTSWKPTLSSPSNGASLPHSTDVTLVWSTLSGATQYKVELWGGPYSLMTPCNWQNGTSCHIGGMWPGTMSWHVKARKSTGEESEWSDTWTFIIQN